jgi:hypothetical protein
MNHETFYAIDNIPFYAQNQTYTMRSCFLIGSDERGLLRVYIVQVTRLKFEILQIEKIYCMYLQNI